MNLAELRKKAQNSKAEDEGRLVAPACEIPLLLEPAAEEEVCYEPVPDPQGDVAPGQPEPETEPVKVSPPQQKAFDPVAVLLAGRGAALAEEAAFADAAVVESSTEQFQEFLCFRVSTEMYAINIMAIKEIIKPREITEVPRAPSFVSGVLSLRGIIIPVFDMRLRLGLPAAEKHAKERIIVLKKAEDFLGIIVDEVTRVVRIDSATMEKAPAVLEGIDRDFVSGIGRFDGEMLILLNLEKILDLTLI